MSEPTVDLFKFVALRSPDEPDPILMPFRTIPDVRVKRVIHYPLPDVTMDTDDFADSAAAIEIHTVVADAVAALGSTADVPAANRAIAQHFALQQLRPEAESLHRIDILAAHLLGRPFPSWSDLLNAVTAAVQKIESSQPTGDETGANALSGLLRADLGKAFDALYRAYVAKQVRSLNLESWFDGIRLLYAVLGVHAGQISGMHTAAPPPIPAGVVAIKTLDEFEAVMSALPVVHSMFSLLVGYYRPFNTVQPVGIGDLLVVKQFLQQYEAGEVAHVENVLKGEKKVRTHRVLDRTEDVLTLTAETTEETTRELQTTERFELKAETESTIENDLNVEMSGQVSGRYGVVEVSASAGVSYSLSTTDARRSSNNFAKDVIDRSLSRIQKRVTEERTTRRTHEVEETNLHEIDNPAKGGNITGIYRWLDKRYKAQVYNYGKRMMFEFVLPEPAAFILQAFDRNRDRGGPPDIPQPPGKPNLIISQITQATVDTYADIFALGDVRAEPAAKMSVTKVFTGSGLAGEIATAHEKQFDIPEGYVVSQATISGAYEGVNIVAQGKDWGVFVGVGGRTTSATHPRDGDDNFHQTISQRSLPFDPRLAGALGVSILAYRVVAFEVSVALDLQLTDAARRTWQIGAYDAIMAAYERALSQYKAELTEYRDRLAGYAVSQGILIRGRNPRINQEIIRTELKKSCLAMIALQFDSERLDDIVFDAMKTRTESMDEAAVTRTEVKTVTTTQPDPDTTVTVTTTTMGEQVTTSQVPVNVPAVDVSDAVDEGRVIQFLEQAFEWQQISYVLYPYFWGRLPQKWYDAQRYYDEEDPLFARFLQSGAVRVLVASRPGFEAAVLHYLRTRQPWNGGPAPNIDDPLYLAMHEELRGQQDDLNGAVPYGDPWDVVVPTSLVYLQADATLPTYGEDEDGDAVEEKDKNSPGPQPTAPALSPA
jgi:hypothetical protein